MPRKLRTIAAGITYHCYSHCHNKEDSLETNFGTRIFTEAVQMCQKKYNFELSGVAIVKNHVHLIIKTLEDAETVSRIMQYIKARIAEKYNRAMKKSGAFWNGRFGCKIVEEGFKPEYYAKDVVLYVAYNPVRKQLCTDPRNTTLNFINCYLTENYKLPIKITLHPFFYSLGNTFEEYAKKFLLYEERYLLKSTI